MPKTSMNDMLKRRMTATQQASELQTSDEAYQQIFREKVPANASQLCDLLLDKLLSFFTADIGFRPYSKEKLEALAGQLKEDGLVVRIIVRPVTVDMYEILSGHNRVAAAKLAGWSTIPAEVVEADDARAIVIATSTNLIQRQRLTIIERGKAYKALLDAKNRQGYRSDRDNETSGENRQKYSARALIAEFFGVTEYEIRKAVKLVFAAWREARDAAEKRLAAPPRKISFDRKQFAPYLDNFSNDREIEKLFLEFLQERAKVS